MRTMKVNGVTFEVIIPRKSNVATWMKLFMLDGHKNLHDCYKTPSQTKLNIYAYWRSWFATCLGNGVSFKQFCGVDSYNCNFFTLKGLLTIDGIDYIVQITPYHNRLIKLVTK